MDRITQRNVRVGIILTTIAVAASYAVAGHMHPAPSRSSPRTAQPRPTVQPTRQSPSTLEAKQLGTIQEAVARAIAHLEAGHQQEAMKELKQIQTSLASLRQTLDKQAAPGFVNDRCPIMGAPIDPSRISTALMRTHAGQKVAFCCGGCPQAWDRLSNSEKTAKLASVRAQPQSQTVPPQNTTPAPHGMQHQH